MSSNSLKPIFLTARWKYLLMANYTVDPKILSSYIPRGTELDVYQGETYVSMVGFRFVDTKVLGIPIPFHRNFTEVNLRFYVRYKTSEGWRRGTSFISEIVPKPAIAWLANFAYHEHYSFAFMQHSISTENQVLEVEYGWKKGGKNFMRATAHPTTNPLEPDSIEQFIAEHYWGYNAYNDHTTLEYGVEHPPWSYFSVTDFESYYQTEALYGATFVPYLAQAPKSVFIADGSKVTVRKGNKFSFSS